jgi:hypothetical protein
MDKVLEHSFQLANVQKNLRRGLILLVFTGLSGFVHDALAQQRVLDVGLRAQKAVGMYYENGLILQYTDERLAAERLYLGLSYVSSRLGTAFNSNAIRQDQFLLSASYLFRPGHVLRPMLRANTGYFVADFESPLFDELPNTSLLLSSEAGICIDPAHPLKWMVSIGYNFISGNGVDGPGTLYPLFLQTSLSWDLFYYRRK